MPLEFMGDAICLSGTTGSKMKTSILSAYYRFWLNVTSGGPRMEYRRQTYVVDMNAGTGELGIRDTGEIILGSAGHALDLRYGSGRERYASLSIALVEPDPSCRQKLLRVVARRWPDVNLSETREGWHLSEDKMTILFESQADFMRFTKAGSMPRISLFYFDPLLATEWSIIDSIAEARIVTPYKMGTEFLVFFFTSDWLMGRKGFEALPRTSNEDDWSESQKETALLADEAFGGRSWFDVLTNTSNAKDLETRLVQHYRLTLRKWFRFVQPLPFIPKEGQRYDLFCCSNFSVGTRVIADFYKAQTRPFGLQENNNVVYRKFIQSHPETVSGPPKRHGRVRPLEWQVLWYIMKNHIDGVCDGRCRQIRKRAYGAQNLKIILKWLKERTYIRQIEPAEWPWTTRKFPLYKIAWSVVDEVLGVKRPLEPEPLKPGPICKVGDEPENYVNLTDFF